jgi:hypothetical protein
LEVSWTIDTAFSQYQSDPPFTDIKPFHLHLQLDNEAYLCPVRALADWLSVSEIKEGYLFRQMDVSDRVTEKPMVSLHHTPLAFVVSSV